MSRCVGVLGALLILSCAWPSHAQQFTATLGTKSPPSKTFTTNTPGLFSQTMARPSFTAMYAKPTMPSPLNLGSMLPSFPNLQNTMLLRNIFGGPQSSFKVISPPAKKK